MCRGDGLGADSGCWGSEGGERSDGRCGHISSEGEDRGGGIEFGYKTIFLSKLTWLHLMLVDGCGKTKKGRILIGYMNTSVNVIDDIGGGDMGCRVEIDPQFV
ncbi:hypothetical protein A2U01_0017915 [Trifolium medium]|uniref:Uncharacterized protein n=1 Tax=Trifolium medium TaxID=97028 RepID=A0A392NED2_9FABA|nr:hypothetical protein [Trifolium medium]